eukprot:TRINITY_DN16864_c0_g1_i1.p1 TRINITY_DN16864_c0_g1~~TRINITY_DN16864_c0_g1_i1.p1  ORF type:complete len:655 (-),score=116.43 TRINITY_DN16864_c0_g1_i1:46-2010(-)
MSQEEEEHNTKEVSKFHNLPKSVLVQLLIERDKELAKIKQDKEDLQTKFIEETVHRRELFNKLQELKGNIRVFCRVRPLAPDEIAHNDNSVLEICSDDTLQLLTKQFTFDRVFSPHFTQEQVFSYVEPLVQSFLDGFNCCIFAYGQTGTGKTYTMVGVPENRGVNYRVIDKMFQYSSERKSRVKYTFSISMLEIYNENLVDLLIEKHEGANSLKLRVNNDQVYVENLVKKEVNSLAEVWDCMELGHSNRSVALTMMNDHSSRSHCIVSIEAIAEYVLTNMRTESKFYLVDLAGSERVSKSKVDGTVLTETKNINKSLAMLGDVIQALHKKLKHIPYRNSKLTHLLKDALGGDSKTLMFVQISPVSSSAAETLCSLNFASRVKNTEIAPAKKQVEYRRSNVLSKATAVQQQPREIMKMKNKENIDSQTNSECITDRKQKTRELEKENSRLRLEIDFLQQKITKMERKNTSTFPPIATKALMQLNLQQTRRNSLLTSRSFSLPKLSEVPNDETESVENESVFETSNGEESDEDPSYDTEKENNPDNYVTIMTQPAIPLKSILRLNDRDNEPMNAARPKKTVRFTLADQMKQINVGTKARRVSVLPPLRLRANPKNDRGARFSSVNTSQKRRALQSRVTPAKKKKMSVLPKREMKLK